MIKYLLLKLAEEAGEVVVAAVKHRIHRSKQTRRRLEGEVADLLAIVDLLIERGGLKPGRITKLQSERHARELSRLR